MVMTEGSAEFKRGIRSCGNPGSGWRDNMSEHSNLNAWAITGDDIVFSGHGPSGEGQYRKPAPA